MKAFQAYASGGFCTAAETPRKAAESFFSRFPSKRKCNIIEGESDGHFFTVTYGRTSEGQWPMSIKDVTRGGVAALPDVAA